MYERFTDTARKVMQLANQEAQRFKHEYVGSEHILLGLVREGSGVGVAVLRNLDVDPRKIRNELEKRMAAGPDMVTMGKLPQTPHAKKVITYAVEEAQNLNHNYVGDEHLLLGLLRLQEGIAFEVLTSLGLQLDETREEVLNLLGHGMDPGDERKQFTARSGRSKTPALDSFGRDLTELARQGRLLASVGRDEVYLRLIPLLVPGCRLIPVLIGQPGVGKTTIVEGLAQKIVDDRVPEFLRDRRIVSVNLAMMLAGTKYRGQFEERMLVMFEETRRAKNVILFLDEFHVMGRSPAAGRAVGPAGRLERGGQPVHVGDCEIFACSLKPRLSRGEVSCIGAASAADYQGWLQESTLASHLRAIVVEPIRGDSLLEALRTQRDRLESHHRVEILDEGLEAAAVLSERYLWGLAQPVRAVRVLEEAASLARDGEVATQMSLAELEELIEPLQRELGQAQADGDAERGERIGKQLARAEARQATLIREIQDETQLAELVELIRSLDESKEEHVAEQNFDKAIAARDQADRLKKRTKEILQEQRERRTEAFGRLEWETVARVVSGQTGLPLRSISSRESESKRVLDLESRLNTRILGQTEAVAIVSRAMRHGWSGLKGPGRPVAGLLLVGPRGVGKTHLAACLAEELFGAGAFLEVDLSDFRDGESPDSLAWTLFGGRRRGGHSPRPPGVVLFDQLDHAPAGFWGSLRQLLEPVQAADSVGRSLGLQHMVFLLSVSTESPPEPLADDVASRYRGLREALERALNRRLSPTELTGIDDIVPFHALDRATLRALLDARLGQLGDHLGARGVRLDVTPAAKDRLVDEGTNPETGAHLLPRAVERLIEGPLNEFLHRLAHHGPILIKIDVAHSHCSHGGLVLRAGGPPDGPAEASGQGGNSPSRDVP